MGFKILMHSLYSIPVRGLLIRLLMLWTLFLLGLPHSVAQGQSPPSPTVVRSSLKEILQGEEFRPDTKSQTPQFITKLRDDLEKGWQKLKDWLRHLFRVRTGNMSSVSSAFVYALIALFFVLSGWLIARIARSFVYRRPKKPTPITTVVETTGEETSDSQEAQRPDDLLIQARQMAEARDFRRAFRAVFLAILLHLDQIGELAYKKSSTNGDFLGLLKATNRTEIYSRLQPLARQFELYWYGNRLATEADYKRCLNAYQHFINEPRTPNRSESNSPTVNDAVRVSHMLRQK